MSEGVSTMKRASEASSVEQANEWAMLAEDQADERFASISYHFQSKWAEGKWNLLNEYRKILYEWSLVYVKGQETFTQARKWDV